MIELLARETTPPPERKRPVAVMELEAFRAIVPALVMVPMPRVRVFAGWKERVWTGSRLRPSAVALMFRFTTRAVGLLRMAVLPLEGRALDQLRGSDQRPLSGPM